MKKKKPDLRRKAHGARPKKIHALAVSPADNILALIHVFSNLIGQAFYNEVETRHKLTIPQWRILLTLANHPGAMAVDIISRWALQPMSVSRAIRELEQRRLIIRRTDARDRRSQELYLTSEGQRVYSTVVPDANARYHDIVDCLAQRDRAQLAQSLVKLIHNTKRLIP